MEENKEEKVPESKVVVEKNKVSKFLKIFSVILLIIVIVALITFKIYNPEFDIKWVIIIGVIFAFVSLIIFFGFEIINKFKKGSKDDKSDNKPASITLKQAQELARTIIGSELFDYMDTPEDEGVEEHGRNIKEKIYSIYGRTIYTGQMCFVAINMHYPETNRRYKINPNKREILLIKKNLCTDPEESPDKEIIERRNPLLGTEEKIIKSSKKKELPKTEIKKEDL